MRLTPKQREALETIADGRMVPALVREDDGWHARWRALGADNPWIDSFVREAAVTPLSRGAENQRHETLHDAWMMALRSETGLVRWDDAECAAFAAELSEWNGAADDESAARKDIVFRFTAEGADSFTIACPVPKGRRALKALGQATFVFGPLRAMERRGGVLAVDLSRAEAESFLRRGARELSLAGYGVEGVDLSAAVEAEVDLAGGEGEGAPAGDGKLTAKLVVRVAGEIVTAEEVRFLLEQKSTLVFFRDRWIEVDRNILKEALRALEKNAERKLSVNAAMGFACGIGSVGKMEIEKARAHGWLRGLVEELRRRVAGADGADAGRGGVSATPGLAGELRPYQKRGVAWMRFLTECGFGALLADDMGLGKTVQTIAWILESRRKTSSAGPFLIIAPVTLVSNWKHELAKFAPDLRVMVHHGETRATETLFRRGSAKADVVLTAYSLLVRDYRILRTVAWAGTILDEAQAIKNPDTRVARAACALGAPRRLALTGTPVENSVADVWSIENYLNPGFLSDRKSFAERFVKPIAANEKSAAAKRLRHALEPFVLRRLKTDGEIAAELGVKREMREYCALSAAQRREYEDALQDYRGTERSRGDIFALITRLKLVCDGAGKTDRLLELVESVFAAGESVLVFSQYAKVGAKIKSLLDEKFACDTPFLHGSLSAREREREIARFNEGGPKAFVLSLRAGGYGLNLVKATHVVHFDRWWNPAVEAQATDRAYRIGQKGTVFVHTFITEGTLEERVDEILETKSRVAGTLVAGGESFLMSLKPEELEEAVRLAP